MAVGHNLISCDDLNYPSIFNRHNTLFPPIVGTTVEFNTVVDKYYTVEKNNQAFFPYPSLFGDGAYVLITLTSVKYNLVETLSSPVAINTALETKTNISTGASNPPVFPADYTMSWLKFANYVSGTTYGIGLTNAIQNSLDSAGVDSVIVRRTSKQPITSGGTPVSFANFCIHKRQSDSIIIEYTLEYHPSAGPVTTDAIVINFTSNTASYKEDAVETQISGNLAQEYVTDESALRLFDFPFTSYEEKDCPCEMCDNCFLLTNCTDKTIWMRTYTDLSELVGQVVELEEIEGCWLVEPCISKIEVTVKESYVHCKACQPKCYTPKCN